MEIFEKLIFADELQNYIDENFEKDLEENFEEYAEVEESKFFSEPPQYSRRSESEKSSKPSVYGFANIFDVDFKQIRDAEHEETFSDKLQRLIRERGEKNSSIYKRANIDRRHFSKICNHREYQPSKFTVLAFAVALKLNFEKTQELLASAGYTLTKNNLADVIISFFIDKKFFDVDEINQYLYKYEQPLLGG